MGLAVWCEDEAGPFQTVPHPGGSWRPEARPATQSHEYVRAGTAEILTRSTPPRGGSASARRPAARTRSCMVG